MISVSETDGDCGLGIADCGLRIADWGLRISDFGLRIGDYFLVAEAPLFAIACSRCSVPTQLAAKFESSNPQSTIRNPQSAISSLFRFLLGPCCGAHDAGVVTQAGWDNRKRIFE